VNVVCLMRYLLDFVWAWISIDAFFQSLGFWKQAISGSGV
jgi:hypothetical protein